MLKMKSWNYFILIFGLCISNGLAFGFLFKRHVETEPTIPSVSSTPNVETSYVEQQITPKQAKNWFANVDDVFRTMTNDFAKKAQQRLAQLEQSVFTNIQQEVNQFQPVISGMQNKTAKEIRKPDIYSAEDIVPLEANNLDTTDVVKPYDLSRDTIVNDRIAETQKSSGLQTIDPNAELIEINVKSPQARYNEYDSATLIDLSGDTKVNDRIAEQQALSGIISVHPGAEIFDVDKNGKPISPIDNDVKSSKHQPNRKPQTKKSSGLKTADPRTKLTEKSDKRANYDDDSIPLVDLSGDTRVNDRVAEQQALSGIITVHPGAEVFDMDVNSKPILPIDNDVESSEHQLNRIDQSDANLNRIVQPSASGFVITEPDYELLDNSAKNSRNYYYYVPDTIQQVRVADLSRDTIVNDRIAEQQAASGMVMIDPEAEFIDNRRLVARPSTNHYRAAARVQKNIPRRDLSRDTVVNDRISQQQTASGLIRIDPDAELIDTGANNLNNMYYNYVPNTIDEYNRRKRTESWNQIYQRPVAQPVPPRIVYYSW